MGVSLRKVEMPKKIKSKYWFITRFYAGGLITYPINEKGRLFMIMTVLSTVS
jgi:hypothetical protein